MAVEVAYIGDDGIVRIRDGATGALENGGNEAAFTFPGAEALVADFRGLGDRDALVQYSQRELRAIRSKTARRSGTTTEWSGMEHSAVRVADMDGDGIDEVIGPNFLGADGERLNALGPGGGSRYGARRPRQLERRRHRARAPLEMALAETAPDESGIGVQSGETIVVNPDAIAGAPRVPREDIPPTGQCATEKDPDMIQKSFVTNGPTRHVLRDVSLDIEQASSCRLSAPWGAASRRCSACSPV